MRLVLPYNARFIIDRLQQNGHTCFAVGGCVRDSILGREPADWDFTTSALPEEIEKAFSDCRTLNFGKQFGTIGIILDNEQYEVTTYRLDGEYSDARHPDAVSFSSSLRDDLSRRDFTVNAMAYNDTDGLIDYYDGQKDLHYGVIRCVGVATNRFAEDALRILRALRFASTLGFSIESSTSAAILSGRKMLSAIASERITDELLKLLCGEKVDFVLRRYRSVFTVFIPELLGTFDFEQNSKHHNRDLYRHTVAAVKNIEPDPLLRITMLFHDIGKPMTRTVDQFGVAYYKNHPMLGAAMTEEILRRLCLPRRFIEEVTTLIRYHDVQLCQDSVLIKQLLGTLGVETVQRLFQVERADIMAQSMYKREEKLADLAAAQEEAERILSSGECYNLRMLNINGSDLLHLGITSGEEIGRMLETLLQKVISGEVNNERTDLVAAVKAI